MMKMPNENFQVKNLIETSIKAHLQSIEPTNIQLCLSTNQPPPPNHKYKISSSLSRYSFYYRGLGDVF